MMAESILFLWGLYYFVCKVDYKRFKDTWVNLLKGIGFLLCGKVMGIFMTSLYAGGADSYRVDMVFGLPLLIWTIVKVAKLFNERDELKRSRNKEK